MGFIANLLVGFSAHAAPQDARANRLLAQARNAIGGEGKLAAVRGVSMTGAFTKQMPDHVQTGALQIDLQLPDKLLRTDTVRPGGDGVFVMLRGVNGDMLLRNSKIVNAGPGARMSRPPLMGGTDAEAIVNARADLARLTLALLLTAPASMALQFSDGGVAESPDGKADVLVVTGANGFAARVFLDPPSHHVLMLTYRGPDPRMFPPSGRVAAARPTPAPTDHAIGAADPVAPALVDITLFLDEYRAESGLILPHRASLAVDGAIEENWTFKTIRINPQFGPGAFSDK